MIVIRILVFLFFGACVLTHFPSVSSVIFLAAAIILFPFGKLREKMDSVISSRVIRVIICIFLFVTGVAFAPSNSNSEVDIPEKETQKQTEAKPTEPTKEDYITSCVQVDYKSVERDPGLFEGKQIVVKGEVIQVMEGWFNSVTMRIESDAGMWYATYTAGENESRILEGDYLTVYGECDGVESYTTILGGQMTIPSIKVKYYELTEKFAISEEDNKNKIPAGHYKVGTDIPAGYYYFFSTDSFSFFKCSTDANGEDLVEYDSFDSFTMYSVHNGEYLELNNCYALPSGSDVTIRPLDGYYADGFYVVGVHIPAGEYKVEQTPGASFASYALYGDLRRDDLITYKSVDGSHYINLEDGQYLKLSDCRIYIGE